MIYKCSTWDLKKSWMRRVTIVTQIIKQNGYLWQSHYSGVFIQYEANLQVVLKKNRMNRMTKKPVLIVCVTSRRYHVSQVWHMQKTLRNGFLAYTPLVYSSGFPPILTPIKMSIIFTYWSNTAFTHESINTVGF